MNQFVFTIAYRSAAKDRLQTSDLLGSCTAHKYLLVFLQSYENWRVFPFHFLNIHLKSTWFQRTLPDTNLNKLVWCEFAGHSPRSRSRKRPVRRRRYIIPFAVSVVRWRCQRCASAINWLSAVWSRPDVCLGLASDEASSSSPSKPKGPQVQNVTATGNHKDIIAKCYYSQAEDKLIPLFFFF